MEAVWAGRSVQTPEGQIATGLSGNSPALLEFGGHHGYGQSLWWLAFLLMVIHRKLPSDYYAPDTPPILWSTLN